MGAGIACCFVYPVSCSFVLFGTIRTGKIEIRRRLCYTSKSRICFPQCGGRASFREQNAAQFFCVCLVPEGGLFLWRRKHEKDDFPASCADHDPGALRLRQVCGSRCRRRHLHPHGSGRRHDQQLQPAGRESRRALRGCGRQPRDGRQAQHRRRRGAHQLAALRGGPEAGCELWL